jgi:hypothetical protein
MVTNEMVRLLVRWYGLTAESAVEIIAELRSRKSLESLACGYRVARAVPVSTPPADF